MQKHLKRLKYIVDEIIVDTRRLWTHIERVERMEEGQVQNFYTIQRLAEKITKPGEDGNGSYQSKWGYK